MARSSANPWRFDRRRCLRLSLGLVAAILAGRPRLALAEEPAPFSLERFRQLCLETARANLRPDGWLIPSAAYPDECYLRDAYWTLRALRDPELARRIFERFAAAQDPDGRLPTSLRLADGGASHIRDDESTALFLLLGLDLVRSGWSGDRGPLARATRFLLDRLDEDGTYQTGPGAGSWWLDTLVLAARDTVTYNQGIVAVALRAARELGLEAPERQVAAAERAYRELYRADLGTLPLSARTTLRDVSSLVGDYLAWSYFGQPLLAAEQVRSTLAGFARATFPDGDFLGFRVATQLDGSFMPPSWFAPAPDNFPGHYHNGGSWLLYDALALGSALRHGVAEAAELLAARLRAEVRADWSLHEYLATDPDQPDFGSVPFPWRRDYAWNAYAGRIIEEQL